MGEAKRRGSFEQRKEQAQKRRVPLFKSAQGKRKSKLVPLLAAIMGFGGVK